MANFIALVDSNAERRRAFVAKVEERISPYANLRLGRCESGIFSVLWSAGKKAPISSVSDEKGCSIIFGDAIRLTGSGSIEATELREKWGDGEKSTFYNGYFCALVFNASGSLKVGGDLLGFYPLYYYEGNDFLLVGSSPFLFRYHPGFTPVLDQAGLIGILLTMHLINGQTLMKGVRRLAAGHLLNWRKGSAPVELRQYDLPVSDKYFSLPFSAHLSLLDETIRETLRGHVCEERHNLLLSGGLDSRMLAGYLDEMDVSPYAVTFGRESESEAFCAKKVACSLKLNHRTVEIPYSDYPTSARIRTNVDGLSSGFGELTEWAAPGILGETAPRVILGHSFDAVIGTRYLNWAYEPDSHSMSFATYFRNINRYGFTPDMLHRLLKPRTCADQIEETILRIKNMYESYSDIESQRAWCFNLYNRQRFHVANGAFPISFGSWPVIPALDYRLLCCAGGMPASSIGERRAQIALFSRRFPELAALPLDQNADTTDPIRPRLRYQIGKAIRSRFPWRRNSGNGDGRYYARIYNLNNPGWRAVRKEAEPYREKLGDLLDMNMLTELLPGPDTLLRLDDPIVNGSGRKLLLGLMLWARDYL